MIVLKKELSYTTMLDCLLITFLIIEVSLLATYERYVYGTWVTPLCVLALPYTFIVMIAELFGPSLGFIPLYTESVIVWMIGLFLFWLSGQFVALPHMKLVRKRTDVELPLRYEKASEIVVLLLAWICILIMGGKLLFILKTLGLQSVGTDHFAKLYGYGFAGHARVFSMGLMIFLIGNLRSNTHQALNILTIAVLVCLYIFYPVKGWLIVPILGGLIYRIASRKSKISFYFVMLIFVFGLVAFFVFYLIEFGVKNMEILFDSRIYLELLQHFGAYLFGGILSLGDIMQKGTLYNIIENPKVLLAPLYNLWAVLTSGDLISPIQSYFSIISLDGIKISNVHTFFGAILINSGCFGSVGFVIFLGVLSYFFFILANVSSNCWFMVMWSFIAAMLSLGWFEYYFWHLPVIEVPVYCATLGLFFWANRVSKLLNERHKVAHSSD